MTVRSVKQGKGCGHNESVEAAQHGEAVVVFDPVDPHLVSPLKRNPLSVGIQAEDVGVGDGAMLPDPASCCDVPEDVNVPNRAEKEEHRKNRDETQTDSFNGG